MGDVFLSGTAKMNPNYMRDKVAPEMELITDEEETFEEGRKVSNILFVIVRRGKSIFSKLTNSLKSK